MTNEPEVERGPRKFGSENIANAQSGANDGPDFYARNQG